MPTPSLKNLPPKVARELLRHVAPASKGSKNKTASVTAAGGRNWYHNRDEEQTKKLKYVLAGCIAFTGAAFSMPVLVTYWIGDLVSREEALTGPQIRRGAFNNSGSKDVGRDPNWDFKTGKYIKDDGYYEIFKEDKNLPAQFHNVPPEELREYEEQMRAFATGKTDIEGRPRPTQY